jgi:hypothetical protein
MGDEGDGGGQAGPLDVYTRLWEPRMKRVVIRVAEVPSTTEYAGPLSTRPSTMKSGKAAMA